MCRRNDKRRAGIPIPRPLTDASRSKATNPYSNVNATSSVENDAWVIRYFLFALNPSDELILTGIALNGICHVFLIIVIQLFIDAKSRSDLKASAQNLFAFLTMGIAMPIGFLLAGKLGEYCKIDDL